MTAATADRFEGKVALVTGASSGIGREVARRLAAEGARVGALARSTPALEALVEEIAAAGGEAIVLSADVGVATEVEGAIERLVAAFGGLDLIAHAAGISWPAGEIVDLTEADWDQIHDVNAKSCFLLAHHGIPLMRARGGGAVVNVTSVIATSTAATASAYAAAKAAANMFTRTAALETVRDGIRFNAVAPGVVRTAMVEADARRDGVDWDTYEKTLEQMLPAGKLIESEEVASLVLFLLSDEASAVTGAIHTVDDGWTAQINISGIS